jgi:DNA end-binding protein Ku
VKGYEFTKDRYVTFSDAELKGLEAEANRAVDIQEFVPLAEVDPIYYEGAHYLGPDKGAEKAYHLLAQAMRDTERGAVAHYTSHGKENLALIRPFGKGLVLHAMHYAEEVRSFDDVDTGGSPKVRPAESELARKLIAELSVDAFEPGQHRDAYRERVQAAVDKKVAGSDAPPPRPSSASPRGPSVAPTAGSR